MVPIGIIAVFLLTPLTATRISIERPVLYLQGSARVDGNSPTSFKEGSLLCDSSTNQCSCYGQTCKVINKSVKLCNITVLTMKDTTFDKISPYSFLGLKRLEKLEVMQGSLVRVFPNAFATLSNLKELNLAVNMITTLYPLSFNGLRKLERIILMKNEIKNLALIIPSLVPSLLPKLAHIHMGGNPINVLNEKTFEALSQSDIKTLEVIMCELQYVHPNTLSPLSKLEEFYLGGNDKMRTDNLVALFENLVNTSLKLLDISSMSFSDIPVSLLEVVGRSNVSILMLAKTSMPTIANNQFPYMPNLETLLLFGNRVQSVEQHAFANLPNLKHLYMQKNVMTVFPPGLRLRGLEELDVDGFSHFPIRFELNEFSFSEMKSLKVLKISYKTLLELKRNTFKGLSSLEELHLRSCGITSLEDGVFQHLISLRLLDISENQILETKANVFAGLNTVRHLIYQNAQATDVEAKVWMDLRNVEVLDLSRNSFVQIKPILLHLQRITKLNLTSNKIQFWDKSVLREDNTLQALDLSGNYIRRVSPIMIRDFEKLLFVNVTRNPFRCSCDQLPFLSWLSTTNVSVYKYGYALSEYNSCHEPTAYSSLSLRAAKENLTLTCQITEEKHQAPLIALLLTVSLILALLFFSVVSFYVFRHKILAKIMSSEVRVSSDKGFLFDAFVSYSNYDSEWVFNVFLPAIENSTSNAKLCVYDRDFVAGKAITDCIVDGIKKSRKTILIVSKHFLTSSWCKFETNLAQSVLSEEKREGLVMIKLGDVDISKADSGLRFLLQSRLYLTWSNDPTRSKDFWRKLDKALEKPSGKTRQKSILSSLL